MGILSIVNRSENWKTARHFIRLDAEARVRLVQRLGKTAGPAGGQVRLELFWRGMRDYLHSRSGSGKKWEEDLARRYDRLFPELRRDIDGFDGGTRFARLRPGNYDISCQENVRALFSNLRNTEIDVVIEAPGHLFIGEAKHESILRGNGRNVLVHQFVRQYVMARILVELIAEDNDDKVMKVVPFIVADEKNLRKVRRRTQVRFMMRKGWLSEENILSWNEIPSA